MNSNEIEFNKNYTKLPAGIKTAVLIACESMRIEEQEQSFLNYDTHYTYCEYPKMGAYDYPKVLVGDYLCLVLKSDSGAIFTTLRKDNKENRGKYMILVDRGDKVGLCQEPRYGKYFQIIIKEG